MSYENLVPGTPEYDKFWALTEKETMYTPEEFEFILPLAPEWAREIVSDQRLKTSKLDPSEAWDTQMIFQSREGSGYKPVPKHGLPERLASELKKLGYEGPNTLEAQEAFLRELLWYGTQDQNVTNLPTDLFYALVRQGGMQNIEDEYGRKRQTVLENPKSKNLKETKELQELWRQGKISINPSYLGGAGSITDLVSLRKDQGKIEGMLGKYWKDFFEENKTGTASEGAGRFGWALLFSDPTFEKDLTLPLSEEANQMMIDAHGGFADGQLGINQFDDSLYAIYDEMPDTKPGSDLYKSIKHYMEYTLGLPTEKHKQFVNTPGMYGGAEIDVDPVADFIQNNGKAFSDGRFYLPLQQFPNERNDLVKDLLTKQYGSSAWGQAIAIGDIIIAPFSGVYTGAVRGTYRGVKFATDKTGKLIGESFDNLLKLAKGDKAKALEMQKAIEAQTKVRTMFSKSNKPSITQAAHKNTAELAAEMVDLNLSYSENLAIINQALAGQKVRGAGAPIQANNTRLRQSIQNVFKENNQLSVKEYEQGLISLINNKGKVDLPENWFAGFQKTDFDTVKAWNNVTREIANLKTARQNLLDSGKYSLKDLTNAINNYRIYSYSPVEYAAYKAKQAGYRSKNYTGSKHEARVLGLKEYGIKLSDREQSIFDQVNFIYKTDTSVALKNNAELQQTILNNDQILNDLSYRVSASSGTIFKADDLSIVKSRLINNEFDKLKYTQTFYETDHIMSVETANKLGVNGLNNVQTLPKTINNDFKKPADQFIAKLLKQDTVSPEDVAKVHEIVKTAEQLGVTMYIDDVNNVFGFGKKYVGAPFRELGAEGVPSYVNQTESIINRYSPGVELRDLNLNVGHNRPPKEQGGYIRQGYADPGGYVDKITGGVFTPFIQDLIAKDKGEKPRVETPYQIAQYLDEETDYLERVREGVVEPAKDYIDRVKKPVEVQLDEVLAEAREQLNPGKPVKFKFSELHRLITQSPLIRKPMASTLSWNMAAPLTLEAIAKDVTSFLSGKGVEDSEIMKVYPKLQAIAQGVGQVNYKNEEEYISAIDEINKAVDTGLTNFAFNTLDLVFAGVDLSGHTDFQRKLREEYADMDLDKPETFLGKVLAFGTEMAVPYTLVIKLVNRFRKVMAVKGINTFATSLDDLSGVARATTRVSNIAKRVGVGAATFGVADTMIGRYSSVHDMFENDPYLFMKGKEDVEGLSGRDLALANFRNRARFGADGAMIGGLFPLVGPPAWAITKGLTKHVAAPTIGAGAKLLNVPITLIADTLAGRIPYTKKMIPGGVGELIATGSKMGAQGVRAINSFIGKQIITRAALGGMDAMQFGSRAYTGFSEYMKPTVARQLPEFSKWRMFSVNSADPLKQNLARIDNVLSVFRDIGKLSQDAFYLSTGSRMFVNSNMRKVEKHLDIIEKNAYNLAKGFQNRYNKHNDSKASSQAYLEQVLGYLKGSVKLVDLPEQLRQQSKALKNHLNEMKTQFKDLLPEGSGLRMALEKSLSEYMRKSFATFTNPNYYPGKESVDASIKYVSQIISKNPILVEEARMVAPGLPTAAAIKEYAQIRVADIMKIGKWEIDDPILALTKMARRDLDMEDIVIKTGEELPSVIRKLLGEENNLRASVMQTASSVVEQSATKRSLDTISKLGTEGGWLFNTAEEALARGKILNAQRIEGNPGTGLLVSDIIGKYTTPELAKQFSNVNLFDSWLKSKIYQNLIAFKAMVQGGKTLYSPATQARNFGSASLFALNQGHIGGASTVTEAFKMVADDIFGAGKNINQQELLEHIARKVRLGVIDENIVANELGAVLRDLKRGEVAGLNNLFQRVGEKKMSKLVQRLYAGGDNVWKWYGHEYLKSQLTGSIKSLDEVARYFQNTIGRKFNFTDEFTGKTKTLAEGIEEMAAYMVRETYPTYSKVPPVIQALRKFPFGNFISFPAEMLRTSVASAGLSLKHIASDNAALRSLGYRGLLGQMTTLYGVNETSRYVAGQLTGIDQRQIDTYTNYLGPSYMRNHVLIPLTSKNNKGNFKVFDMSAYNPYDFVLAPIEGVIKNLNRDKLDPAAIEEDLLGRVFDVAGPMAGFIEPFIAETIGLQPFFDVMPAGYALGGRGGVTKSGKLIYGPRDTLSEKFNKGFSHILESVAPGVVTTSMKMYQAAAGEIQQGEKMDLGDQFFKLMGGSTMVVNPTKSLDYAISNIQKIRGDVFKTTHFYTDDNWENRPPAVMVEELENIQRNAFRAQYDVWKMLTESIDSGLITQEQAEQALKDRGLNKFKKKLLWYGEFTPVNISEDAMEKRAENIQKAYPDEWINPDDLYPKWDLKDVIDKWKYERFEDYELDKEDELQKVSQAPINVPQNMNVASGPVETPPLPDTSGTPVVPPNINMAGQINQATGLTQTEDALLSPTEKLIRQRQRNRGVV